MLSNVEPPPAPKSVVHTMINLRTRASPQVNSNTRKSTTRAKSPKKSSQDEASKGNKMNFNNSFGSLNGSLSSLNNSFSTLFPAIRLKKHQRPPKATKATKKKNSRNLFLHSSFSATTQTALPTSRMSSVDETPTPPSSSSSSPGGGSPESYLHFSFDEIEFDPNELSGDDNEVLVGTATTKKKPKPKKKPTKDNSQQQPNNNKGLSTTWKSPFVVPTNSATTAKPSNDGTPTKTKKKTHPIHEHQQDLQHMSVQMKKKQVHSQISNGTQQQKLKKSSKQKQRSSPSSSPTQKSQTKKKPTQQKPPSQQQQQQRDKVAKHAKQGNSQKSSSPPRKQQHQDQEQELQHQRRGGMYRTITTEQDLITEITGDHGLPSIIHVYHNHHNPTSDKKKVIQRHLSHDDMELSSIIDKHLMKLARENPSCSFVRVKSLLFTPYVAKHLAGGLKNLLSSSSSSFKPRVLAVRNGAIEAELSDLYPNLCNLKPEDIQEGKFLMDFVMVSGCTKTESCNNRSLLNSFRFTSISRRQEGEGDEKRPEGEGGEETSEN